MTTEPTPLPPCPPETSSPPTYSFDLLFFRRILNLHKILFPGFLSVNVGLFVSLLAVSGLEQFLAYQVGLVTGQFYEVLNDRDLDGFYRVVGFSAVVILSMVVVLSLRQFVTRSMIVGWRRCLTLYLHKIYFSGIKFYEMNVTERRLDNPDQRMTADVDLMCNSYGEILPDLIIVPFTVSFYTYDAFRRTGWVGPAAMFLYFLLSTIVNKVVMSPIVDLTATKERKEGDLRFKHVSVRVHSEALAFHGSPRVEAAKCDSKLRSVCAAQQRLYSWRLVLDLAVNGFSYLSTIITFGVIGISLFSGAYDDVTDSAELSRIISENSFVLMNLVYQLTKLVNISGTAAGMAGATHRIAELAERLENQQPPPNDSIDDDEDSDSDLLDSVATDSPKKDTTVSNGLYRMNKVSISPPNSSSVLISDLTIEVGNENVLIVGRSSAGKSSLLRVLRGLWRPSSGSVDRPADAADDTASAFFLPQRPFFTDGSLREQVVYPLEVVPDRVTLEETEWLEDILRELGMGDLVLRCGGLDCDPGWSWYDALSPGEMQRLAFVRLFFHRPRAAFLDEATSALSTDVEDALYRRCADMGTVLVSVGHRENLRKYHSRVIQVGLPEGGWKMEDSVTL